MSSWGIDYCIARTQDFINECMNNRRDNDYPCDESAYDIAVDICTLVKDAEQVEPKYLVPFIEDWQKKNDRLPA